MDLSKGLSEAQIEELIGDRDYRLFLNPKNELYREKKMRENPPPRAEAIRLMSKNSNLIRRPILVKGKQLVPGFDEQEYGKLVKKQA